MPIGGPDLLRPLSERFPVDQLFELGVERIERMRAGGDADHRRVQFGREVVRTRGLVLSRVLGSALNREPLLFDRDLGPVEHEPRKNGQLARH
jgi:hypothetical protein